MRHVFTSAVTCPVVLCLAALWGCGNSNTGTPPAAHNAGTGGSGAGGQPASGYVVSTPDAGPNLCGNSKIDKGEACDDGTSKNGATTCPYGQTYCQSCITLFLAC